MKIRNSNGRGRGCQNLGGRFYGKWRDMVSCGTDPSTSFVKRCHNRMIRTFLTVGDFLEPLSRSLPKHPHILHESDWLKMLNLTAKLCILSFQKGYLRVKANYLLRENIKLRRLQINHVLAQSGSAAKASNLFCGVEGTQDAKIET